MRETSDHPAGSPEGAVAAPVGRLAGVIFAAVTLATGASAALAAATAPGHVSGAVAGGVASFIGAAMGLLPLVMAGRVKPFALAMAWVFGSSARMIVAAGASVAAVLLADLNPLWTLGAMLAATIAALGAEVLVILPVVGARPATERAP